MTSFNYIHVFIFTVLSLSTFSFLLYLFLVILLRSLFFSCLSLIKLAKFQYDIRSSEIITNPLLCFAVETCYNSSLSLFLTTCSPQIQDSLPEAHWFMHSSLSALRSLNSNLCRRLHRVWYVSHSSIQIFIVLNVLLLITTKSIMPLFWNINVLSFSNCVKLFLKSNRVKMIVILCVYKNCFIAFYQIAIYFAFYHRRVFWISCL